MPRKSFNTFETAGRERWSRAQQCCINDHKFSVKVECLGRDGRLPSITATLAMLGARLLNGAAPVNTCINMKRP